MKKGFTFTYENAFNKDNQQIRPLSEWENESLRRLSEIDQDAVDKFYKKPPEVKDHLLLYFNYSNKEQYFLNAYAPKCFRGSLISYLVYIIISAIPTIFKISSHRVPWEFFSSIVFVFAAFLFVLFLQIRIWLHLRKRDFSYFTKELERSYHE